MVVKESYLHLLKMVLGAVVLAFVVRSFCYDGYYIPSNSMTPTLVKGDFLLASKSSYGYGPFSFPGSRWIIIDKMWRDPPVRGDVIVFRHPRVPNKDCVKRVMAIAGDSVGVKKGIVYVNGYPCPLQKQRASSHGTVFQETLPSGRQHLILKQGMFGKEEYDNTPIVRVPAGSCFVIGDNREASQDSRDQARMGFVPYENLIGRADAFFSIGSRDDS